MIKVPEKFLHLMVERATVFSAKTIMHAIADAIFSVDLKGNVRTMNDVAKKLRENVSPEEFNLLFEDVGRLDPGRVSAMNVTSTKASTRPLSKNMLTMHEQLTQTKEFSVILNTGEKISIEITVSNIMDEQTSLLGYAVVLREVTERQKVHTRMRFLAQHDNLTGLPNRLLLEERVNQAMVLAKRHNTLFAILYVDMNAFKDVNDRYGHRVGDELLCSIAERISTNTRESDTVSRHGGDEFVVLLSEIEDHRDAQNFALKLSRCLKEPHLLQGIKIIVNISIGISIFPHHGSSHEALLEQADRAMFVAKAKVRACGLPISECASAKVTWHRKGAVRCS